MAADMVPEYNTLMEVLLPWLIPLTMTSGSRSSLSTKWRGLFTQSAGVAEHSNELIPSKILVSRLWRGFPTLVAMAVPDLGLVGGTTRKPANLFITSIQFFFP